MMKSFSAKGLLIEQQDFQQVLIRGKGDGSFAETTLFRRFMGKNFNFT